MTRIALQVIAFNVSPWINAMLRNAAPHVDKIYIAYPPRPWAYSEYARANLKNPTALDEIRLEDLGCTIEVVHGDWEYDEDTRNHLLGLARTEGFEWMIIQDADEFYSPESWSRATTLMRSEQLEDTELLITPWFNFWKTPEYVIENHCGGIKSLNEGFAIRCSDPLLRFTFSRTSNAKKRRVIDEPCYHYGYVMSDQQMGLKIQTWAHTKEIADMKQWYRLKWQYWNESTRYLHPGSPIHWSRAIRFPHPQPDFYWEFMPTRKLDEQAKGFVFASQEALWNTRALLKWAVRQLKALSRASLTSRGRSVQKKD